MNYKLIKTCVDNLIKADWEMLDEDRIRVEKDIFEMTPWLYDRRLKSLRSVAIETSSVNQICSYKSSITERKNVDISKIMYREADVCMWLLDDEIRSIYALSNTDKVVSIILKTNKKILCHIDIATTLSEKTIPVTKHEIVGVEGIITDRCINEQVPAQAVYLFEENQKHPTTFTDMDISMLGLTPEEVYVADNIIDIITNKTALDRKTKLNYIVQKINTSIKTGEVIVLEDEI